MATYIPVPVYSEPRYIGDWLKGEIEIPQYYSRDNITLAAPFVVATGTAVLTSQAVTSITVGVGGSGYSASAPPTVTFTGGGGSGATATATVNAAGVVTGYVITAGGTGYTSVPTVAVSYPTNTVTLLSGTVLGKVTSTGYFVQLAPAASDGSQNAVALLCYDTTITGATPKIAPAITRAATVASTQIVFPVGITTNQQAAAVANLALAPALILVRSTV